MPLQHGTSQSAFDANVRELIHSGRKPEQALAIAYSVKRRSRRKVAPKMAPGKSATVHHSKY